LTLTSASAFKNGLALVRRQGRKWREVILVINPAGRVVLEVLSRLEPFSEGLAAASSGDAYGFIAIEGRRVIEPQFDQLEPFKDGLAEVQRAIGTNNYQHTWDSAVRSHGLPSGNEDSTRGEPAVNTGLLLRNSMTR
jgi:WG containing repeat